MAIKLNSPLLADFSEPIEVLIDCHRRIEQFLQMLKAVTEQAINTGDYTLNADRKKALMLALNYFRVSAPRHTEDEEESLFPRLKELNLPELADIISKLDLLEEDHRVADELHEHVENYGSKWLSQKELNKNELVDLLSVLTKLEEHYKEHIKVEEELLFPAAKNVLTKKQQQAVGSEMKDRRKKTPTNIQ